jgi:uncharacterized protein with FMN-binding domain
MRNKGIAAAVAIVVAIVVLVVALHKRQNVQRSSTPVHASSTGGTTSKPSGGSPLASNVNGVFTGPAVEMEYGPVQVAIYVQKGKITDVKAVQYPVDRPRSQSINSQAVPLLRSEVLEGQSANINLISGATFTSNAFASSLSAAIEQEHTKVAAP